MNEIAIVLERSDCFYFPGELIIGQVNVNCRSRFSHRGLELRLKGKYRVHFKKSVFNEEINDYHDKAFTDHQVFLRQEKLIPMANDLQQNMILEGISTIPFEILLPNKSGMPSSFESKFGKIEYKLNVEFRSSGGRKAKKILTVISPMLKIPSYFFKVARNSDKKETCCLCCTSRAIEISVSINRSIFMPGDNIIINANFVNGSSRTITPKICILKYSEFNALSKDEVQTDKISFHEDPVMKGYESREWTNKEYKIPSLWPTVEDAPRQMIKNRYYLNVYLDIPYSHDLQVKFPILIGYYTEQRVVDNYGDFSQKPVFQSYPSTIGWRNLSD